MFVRKFLKIEVFPMKFSILLEKKKWNNKLLYINFHNYYHEYKLNKNNLF